MAVAVLLAVLGLIIFIGFILLMMWKQPGIDHSPSQEISRCVECASLPISLEPQTQRASLTIYRSALERQT